jgi:hypothetical protein
MDTVLVNRVAQSKIVTINLEDFYPQAAIAHFDLKDFLFQGLILKERDFRDDLKNLDWTKYIGTHTIVYCSADAIIPVWAYMLVSTYLKNKAVSIFIGSEDEFINAQYMSKIDQIDIVQFTDLPIVIKGCSSKPVPPLAYAQLTFRLVDVAKSVMYGEPCSMVPVFKKKI